VLGPIFRFCAPILIFGSTVGVGSRFHILSSQTHFWWYRGRRVPCSYFALTCSFSTVAWASGLVFKFCAHKLIFGGTIGAGSSFHVLRSQTRFA
jgi:hypothetical protein